MARKLSYKHKSKIKIRDKARPIGQDSFNIEIRLLPVYFTDQHRRYASPASKVKYDEYEAAILTVKKNLGDYKIIKDVRRGMFVNAKILLKDENDLLYFILAHSKMIFRIYRYV